MCHLGPLSLGCSSLQGGDVPWEIKGWLAFNVVIE